MSWADGGDCSEPLEIAEHDETLCPAGLTVCPRCSHQYGARVKATREPYEVWSSDSPATLAFWDGYYGRPLRSNE